MSATKAGEKTVGEIMTREVFTIPGGATLQEVATLLTARNISGAPVVDENGKMIGIISESDLLSEARRRSGLPHMAAFGAFILPEETLKRIYQGGATLLAQEVMTRDVITVTPDLTVSGAGDLMVKRRINRVPVVDEANNLVGIITREDILRAMFHVE